MDGADTLPVLPCRQGLVERCMLPKAPARYPGDGLLDVEAVLLV